MQQTSYTKLSESQKQLLDSAQKALENSYSPYSGYAVGAALLTVTGEIILGTNYENASYGLTMCAERVAYANANTAGKKNIVSVAIIAKNKNNHSDEIVSSCGSCRQVLFEASVCSKLPLEVIMSNFAKDKIIISNIEELLPLAFGSKNLS